MRSAVTVNSPNFRVVYRLGWDANQHFIGGCILDVSHDDKPILSRPFQSQGDARQFALDNGYIRYYKKSNH